MRTEIALHLVGTTNDEFLFLLYRATRAEEMALWGWEPVQQEAFLRFQFSARQRHYAAVFPDARQCIVVEGDRPVGAMLLAPEGENLHLADIALLPEARGRGIGTRLLHTLQEKAQETKQGITLSVRKDNRAARRLYDRLGFQTTNESDMDVQMRWSSDEKGQ